MRMNEYMWTFKEGGGTPAAMSGRALRETRQSAPFYNQPLQLVHSMGQPMFPTPAWHAGEDIMTNRDGTVSFDYWVCHQLVCSQGFYNRV